MGCLFLLQWGGRSTANITGVCGECSQCLGHTGFARAHGMCVFLVYTAQAPGCSAGELSKMGPGFRALPKSKPFRFRFSGTPQRHKLSWACVLCPSQVLAGQVTRCLVRAHPQVQCILSPPPSQPLSFLCAQWERHLRCAVCLFWEADLWLQPSWLMSTIQDPKKTWLATGGLLTVWQGMPSLGLSLPLSGSGCRLPVYLPPVGDGPVHCQLALSGICSVLCSVSGPAVS